MPKVNLLPADLTPKGLTVKAVKTVNLLLAVGFTLFICSSVIVIALFVINSMKLNNLMKDRDQLLVSIKKNQQTEQSLFLIRDRLSKITTLKAEKSCAPIIKDIPQMLAGFPASVSLTSAVFMPAGSEVTLETADSSGVKGLFTAMITAETLSAVNLNAFTYSSGNGYSLGFGLIK